MAQILSQEQEVADWGSLPPELLQLIAIKLANISDYISLITNKLDNISDYIRFRGVCTSWRLAACPSSLQPQLQPQPLLMAFDYLNPYLISYFDPSSGRFKHSEHRDFQYKSVYSLSHGWLLIMAFPSQNIYCGPKKVLLFNPVTRYKFFLPDTPDPHTDKNNIEKVILCSNPASYRPGQLLVAIWSFKQVIFLRQGDKAWTVASYLSGMKDIVYFNDLLYVANSSGRLAILQSGRSLTSLMFHPRWPDVRQIYYLRLLKASEDLLLLLWCYMHDCPEKKLSVFKLDKSIDGEWKWVMIGSNIQSSPGRLCIHNLPDARGWRIHIARTPNYVNNKTVSIQVIDVLTGGGTKQQPYCQPLSPKVVRIETEYDWPTISWFVPGLT